MSIPFVTGWTLAGVELNNSDQQGGFRFANTCGTPITITDLGRWVISGNTGVHTLSLYSTATVPDLLASTTVNCSGAPTGFLYSELASPYVLPAGGTCYVVSSEEVGGDEWYSNGGTNLIYTDIGSITAAWVAADGSSGVNLMDNTRSRGPVSFMYSSPLPNWVKTGNTYYTDGSQYSVRSAYNDSVSGNVVSLPTGRFNWGAASSFVTVAKAVTISGVGTGQSIIEISTGAGTYTNTIIRSTAPTVIRGLTFIQTGTTATSALSFSTSDGWRATECEFLSTGSNPGYFVYGSSYGLIDHCVISTFNGSAEPLFFRGPTGAWETGTLQGTADAVFVENCVFNGPGYPDFNSNARGVLRFNTIRGAAKFDGHGLSTNSPPQSFRSLEIYNNNWLNTGTNWTAIEVRGASAMIFNNTGVSAGSVRFYLTDYGYKGVQVNFGTYMTPVNYPIGYQVGAGQYITVNAADMEQYIMYQIATVGTTDFTTVGAANNNTGTQFIATGPATGNGTVTTTPAATEPAYVWNNKKNNAAWPRTYATVSTGAIALYTGQINDPLATFTEPDLIRSNRDFFADAGFDTYTGVSVGTTAQMNALSPSVTGYGFWVTDQGSWNTTVPSGTAGKLYVWDGSQWGSYYEPYTYPHPMISAQTGNGYIPVYVRLGRHPKLKGIIYVLA